MFSDEFSLHFYYSFGKFADIVKLLKLLFIILVAGISVELISVSHCFVPFQFLFVCLFVKRCTVMSFIVFNSVFCLQREPSCRMLPPPYAF